MTTLLAIAPYLVAGLVGMSIGLIVGDAIWRARMRRVQPNPCDMLADFADGEISIADRGTFTTHLVTCQACQSGLVEHGMLVARLRDLA